MRLALILFAISGGLALLTNLPVPQKAGRVKGLRALLDNGWNRERSDAESVVAANRLTVLKRAKTNNGIKAWFLFFALLLEVGAVAFVVRAAWLAL